MQSSRDMIKGLGVMVQALASTLKQNSQVLSKRSSCQRRGASLNLAVASATLPGFLSGWCRRACCSWRLVTIKNVELGTAPQVEDEVRSWAVSGKVVQVVQVAPTRETQKVLAAGSKSNWGASVQGLAEISAQATACPINDGAISLSSGCSSRLLLSFSRLGKKCMKSTEGRCGCCCKPIGQVGAMMIMMMMMMVVTMMTLMITLTHDADS